MFLDLSRIRSPHERFERVYPADAFADDQDSFAVRAPVSLTCDVFKDKALVRLAGRVQTTLELPCSRCLEPIRTEVDAPFDLRYQPLPGHSAEAEREIAEDDLSTAYYEHETIDLGQLLREQCYLALPMKPLCADDCRGLCPVCGTNVNREPCACHREWEDPRLAPLRELKSVHHKG